MKPSRAMENLEFAAGVGLMLCSRVALGARLRAPVDGWRRAAGLVLRGEPATFVLSAFGLDFWSDVGRPGAASEEQSRAHAARRLRDFLKREPVLHRSIVKGDREDGVVACGGPCYTLAFHPAAGGSDRFVRPSEWLGEMHGTPAGAEPLLNIVCRVDPGGGVDVWVRANHVGIDGVPVQEALSRLEGEWGVVPGVAYPSADDFAPRAVARPLAGRAGLAEVQTFLDFGPLLAWRKQQNAKLPEPLTFSAAMLWRLARCRTLASAHMGTTVEVPAIGPLERGVGVVVVRPEDYGRGSEGLARYARDFNRQMELTRRRTSPRCKLLDAAALIPAGPARALLRRGLERTGDAFGSLGLTVLKDARVFGAPLGDYGHPDGFIAIGSLSLPARGGGQVGCATVKGPAARIADYPAILREAIERKDA